MRIPIPIVGPTYVDRSLPISAQECKNYYPEISEPGGKDVISLIGTPGLVELVQYTGGNISIRGLHVRNGNANNLYLVSGNYMRRVENLIDGIQGFETMGFVDNDNPVIMTNNGITSKEILSTAGGNVGSTGKAYIVIDDTLRYFYELTSAIHGFESENPTHCCYIDGYFIVNDANSAKYYWSNLNDGLTWDPTAVATAEGRGDRLAAVAAFNNELWCFNEDSYQVRYNSGDADNPFVRIDGTLQDVGIGARYSLAQNDTNIFWMSADKQGQGIIWTNEGYMPRRISTGSIEHAILDYSRIDDAVAYTYQLEGHYFYQITFPTADVTWVYDMTTGMWHRKTWFDDGDQHRHRTQTGIYYQGKIVTGDHSNGKLYYYDLEVNTDDGDTIRRVRSSPHIHKNRERVRVASFEIDLETGVGKDAGATGSDPKISLSISKNGGKTFGSEKPRSIGKIGEYRTRVKWNRLGTARDFVFKIVQTDPVRSVIINAVADIY